MFAITSSESLQRFKFTVVIFLIDWTPDAERSPSIFPLSSGERHPSDWFPGTTRLINRRSILIRSRGWELWKTLLKLRGSQTRAQGPSKGLCRGFRRACRDTRLHQQEVRHFKDHWDCFHHEVSNLFPAVFRLFRCFWQTRRGSDTDRSQETNCRRQKNWRTDLTAFTSNWITSFLQNHR